MVLRAKRDAESLGRLSVAGFVARAGIRHQILDGGEGGPPAHRKVAVANHFHSGSRFHQPLPTASLEESCCGWRSQFGPGEHALRPVLNMSASPRLIKSLRSPLRSAREPVYDDRLRRSCVTAGQ
jgi:hypothetical protein